MPIPEESNELAQTFVVEPLNELKNLANKLNVDLWTEEFSTKIDLMSLWPSFRNKFHYPKLKDLPKVDLTKINDMSAEDDCIYFCGHSLGLQPLNTKNKIQTVLDQWCKMGVHGHFEGNAPWTLLEELNKPAMAEIVGAKSEEIGIMNFLSVNLQLMMVSFYQPTQTRYKILIEDKAFPSDHYVAESQIKLHNLNPDECLICLKPRKGEDTLRTQDILEAIEEQGDEIALVLFSGIQYFTGQLFNIKEITEAAHKKGCFIGWDLAHAVGNVELKLHEWDCDFAVWCTYKYLNSGPGSIGALFLNEKHFNDTNMKRLNGWWGHDISSRFEMSNKMKHANGASGYALSTAPSILLSCLNSSLELFEEAGLKKLFHKSKCLTAYLEYLLKEKLSKSFGNEETLFEQITPTNPNERGSHISIRFKCNVKEVYEELEKRGIVCDFRYPNVLRFAPIALYNTFNEVFRFVNILEKCLNMNKNGL